MQIARKLAVTTSVLVLALSAGAQDGLPSIWEAAGDGNESAVKTHLKNGVSPDALEPTLQLTPLMAAVIGIKQGLSGFSLGTRPTLTTRALMEILRSTPRPFWAGATS